jgi:hypothetical protein
MTVAGVSSVLICMVRLRNMRQLSSSLGKKAMRAIRGGFAWLVKNYSVRYHPPKKGRYAYSYYMYGLERAGMLSGVRLIGEHDWYREGAIVLLARQREDGSWSGDYHPIVDTCFALLFLKKATIPLPSR